MENKARFHNLTDPRFDNVVNGAIIMSFEKIWFLDDDRLGRRADGNGSRPETLTARRCKSRRRSR